MLSEFKNTNKMSSKIKQYHASHEKVNNGVSIQHAINGKKNGLSFLITLKMIGLCIEMRQQLKKTIFLLFYYFFLTHF